MMKLYLGPRPAMATWIRVGHGKISKGSRKNNERTTNKQLEPGEQTNNTIKGTAKEQKSGDRKGTVVVSVATAGMKIY